MTQPIEGPLVKDDIEMSIHYVREKNAACAQPLTEMIFSKIEELRDSGYDITFLGSMLTGTTDFIFKNTPEARSDDNDVMVFFHLMKVDMKGVAVDCAAFIAINLTAGTVHDCSANIVSVH